MPKQVNAKTMPRITLSNANPTRNRANADRTIPSAEMLQSGFHQEGFETFCPKAIR
jgi:hypothetical protein